MRFVINVTLFSKSSDDKKKNKKLAWLEKWNVYFENKCGTDKVIFTKFAANEVVKVDAKGLADVWKKWNIWWWQILPYIVNITTSRWFYFETIIISH